MAENPRPVNLPIAAPNLVGSYSTEQSIKNPSFAERYNNLLSKGEEGFPAYNIKDIDTSGRYPLYYPGMDNEEIYAQSQTGWNKAYNGIVKMAGIAGTTFLQGTAGTVYGIVKSIEDGKFSSLYQNPMSEALNDWTKSLEDKYAHYKKLREREGHWWEPENLFTGNFLWDNIVKNFGFSIGTIAGGFAWGAAFKALGITSKLVGMGTEMAAKADGVLGEAAALSQAERLPFISRELNKLYAQGQGLLAKGLINTDRNIVAIASSAGESGIESLNNAQQFREQMIQEFTKTHGYYPQKEEMEEINQYANQVGNWSYGANAALLSLTGYVQLPKIIGSSFKAETKIANDIAFREGKYLSTLPEKGFGKFLYKSKNMAELFVNPIEGVEEGTQFAVTTGTQNYFKKLYNNESPSVLEDGILYGLKEATSSDEGLLNIFTGALSGAMQTSGFLTLGMGGYGNLGRRGFFGYGGTIGTLREEAISALNKTLIRDNFKESFSKAKGAEYIQQEREAAIRQGDVLESKDLEFDYAHTFITNRLKYGASEAIDNELNTLKYEASTDDGFLKLQQEGIAPETDTRESFVNRLNNLQEHSKNVSKLYDTLNTKLRGIVNTKGERVYSDRVIDKLVYAASKIKDYDKRIEQLNAELLSNGVNVSEILSNIENNTKYEDSIKNIIDGIKPDNINKEDIKINIRDIAEISLRRKSFINEYNDIKSSPNKYTEKKAPETVFPVAPEEGEKKPTVKLTTKVGEKELEIGEQYYVGKVVELDSDGHKVFSAPIIKILGQNADGTIQIEIEGEIKNIKPDRLAEYRLGKVSAVNKNPLAKFYMRNWNKVAYWNTGKGKAGKIAGRIAYFSDTNQLFFVYNKKYKGKSKAIFLPIDKEQFYPQGRFKEGLFTFGRELTAEDQADLNEAIEAEKTPQQAKIYEVNSREGRKELIMDFYENLKKGRERVLDLIEEKKNSLSKIKNEIERLTKKIENNQDPMAKRGNKFKPTVKNAIQVVRDLTRDKEELEEELLELEDKQARTEGAIAYMESIKDNLEELPIDAKDFIGELKTDISLLEEEIEETTKQIGSIGALVQSLEEAIDNVVNFIRDLIDDFKKLYPKVPTDIGVNPQGWVDFLKANPNFLKKKPTYREDLQELETIIAGVEESSTLEADTKFLEEVKPQLEFLLSKLDNLEDEFRTKSALLKAFEKAYNDYRNSGIEEEEILKNEEFAKEAKKANREIETRVPEDREYEASQKKAELIVPTATRGSFYGQEEHKREVHERANRFGAKLPLMKNRDEIRGVVVTKNTEKQLGLEGLMDFLAQNKQGIAVDTNTTIALVMVLLDENSNPVLVGEDGQPFAGDWKDNIITQVFPLEGLSDTDGKTMFRSNTSKEVQDYITEQYSKWRKETLASEDLSIHTIDASFGRFEYVEDVDENGNIIKNGRKFKTKTAVEDTGLVEKGKVESNNALIEVPTLSDELQGKTTSFSDVLGRVFLNIKGDYLPLQNRKHTEKESQNIFDAVYWYSKYVLEGKTTSQKAKQLLKWLQSVTYWGFPTKQNGERKPDGFNGIYFEKDSSGKYILTISNGNQKFLFSPTSLERNKKQIIDLLNTMYFNVSNNAVKDLSSSYEEILSIGVDGKVTKRTWKNYQSFLLSKKFIPDDPDFKGDTSVEAIPLTSIVKPVSEEEPVNRNDIYFYITDVNDRYENMPKAAPKIVAKPVQKTAEKNEGEVKTFITPKGSKILYSVKGDGKSSGNIQIEEGEDLGTVIQALAGLIKSKNPNMEQREVGLGAIAALKEMIFEGLPKQEESSEEKATEASSAINSKKRKEALREVIKGKTDNFQTEDWGKIEEWIKSNFPNIPLYRVRNVIQAYGGRQAFGMFKNGALYIYENAEIGTIYHEVFEAIWATFTSPEERASLEKEFRERKGKFTDRPSGKHYFYNSPDVTSSMIKEQLAEELRDYIQYKKIPPKPEKGRPFILKLFADFVDFVKRLLNMPSSKTEELFRNINEGYYKNATPFNRELSYAQKGIIDIEEVFATPEDELRVVLTDRERNEIIENMTYSTLIGLLYSDGDLFEFVRKKQSKKELYQKLKKETIDTLNEMIDEAEEMHNNKELSDDKYNAFKLRQPALIKDVENEWERIAERHQEYLKGYAIEFDENDEIQIADENRIKESDWVDGNKIDHFRKANAALKLFLATAPIVNEDGTLALSSVGGARLNPVGQTYISIMNNVHNARNMEEMLEKFRQMVEKDITYKTLYERLTKNSYKNKKIDFDKVEAEQGVQLLSSFWRTFKKSNPEVKNVYIFEDGEVVIGDASLSSAAAQMRSEYVASIIDAAKSGRYFEFNEKEKVYKGNVSGIRLTDIASRVAFLKNLGIIFTEKEINSLKSNSRRLALHDLFIEATDGILASLKDGLPIATFSNKVLNIHNRLFELGLVRAAISSPDFDSTYFNVNNERTQSFIGTNPLSDFHDWLSQVGDKSEFIGTQYEYLISDVFSSHSVIMQDVFDKDGKKQEKTEKLMKPAYIGGIMNHAKGKQREPSRMNFKERLIMSVNCNLAGYYFNLVPGDASMEWALFMGHRISLKELSSVEPGRLLPEKAYRILKGYLLDEIALTKETRLLAKKRNGKELRFFKAILGEELAAKVVAMDNFEQAYNENKKGIADQVNKAIDAYFTKKNKEYRNTLERYKIVESTAEGWKFNDVNLKDNMSEEEVDEQLTFLTLNFVMNNIELHKLIYGDPFLYKDELKRVKSFGSPSQPIVHSSPMMNYLFDKIWNKGRKKGQIGWINFMRDYLRTVSYQDVVSTDEYLGYDEYEETDAAGIISFPSYRNIRIRNSDWNKDEERQYKYDIAFEKLAKKEELTEEETKIYNAGNPRIRSAYKPLKPKAVGNKQNGTETNDVVLDKYSLYALSYRVVSDINNVAGRETSNALRLYEKMQKEDVDYVVFDTARKVGSQNSQELYKDEQLNPSIYPDEAIVNIPLSIFTIQSEVPSKDDKGVTRGSQVTKLVTMDFMNAGIPVDFMKEEKDFNKKHEAWNSIKTEEERETVSPLYKEIKNNEHLLNRLTQLGYQSVLKRLGIKEEKGKYVIGDFSLAVKTLRDEVLRREVNDNISLALKAFEQGEAILEATPAYQIVRNILYSIADKEVVRPKINGGMKVQIPVTLFENLKVKTEDVNGKLTYTSKELSFYTKENGGVCEIAVARWFKSNKTDEQLLNEWYVVKDGKRTNELTVEGKKILSGVGFRIPTQRQNSIESFVIKQLLPSEFGDVVVVPSALVKKVGSDFDIDKLTIYLKNLFINKSGKPELISYKESDEATKKYYTDVYDEKITKKVERIENSEKFKGQLFNVLDKMETIPSDRITTVNEIIGLSPEEFEFYKENEELIDRIVEQADKRDLAPSDYIFKQIENLGRVKESLEIKFLNESLREDYVNDMFKKAVENDYIQSMQNLISHPENFSRLTAPNSADQLKKLSKEISSKLSGGSFNYEDVANLIDMNFMAELRHAFLIGKNAIGIAAIGQTNNANNQRQLITIDPERRVLNKEDELWLGDGQIKFKEYNKVRVGGRLLPTLSMIKNAERSSKYPEGQDISDIISQFIDGYVDISKDPWIIKLGATPNVTGTFLFLIKVGVPVDTVTFFMNQPIIKDFLLSLENEGYSWLFNSNAVEEIKKEYDSGRTEKLQLSEIPSNLKDTVGVKLSDMNAQQKEQQEFILDEFLKYSKMAQHLFHVTQGSNFDTANFNDPWLVFKKLAQLEKARNTMISNVDDLLNNSFVGIVAENIIKLREALSVFLKSEHPKVRNILERILSEYTDMNDRDFVYIAKKAVTDLFDYALQTDEKFSKEVTNKMIGELSTSAKAINDFVVKAKEDPILKDNKIIQSIEYKPTGKSTKNAVENIKIKALGNKVYDQNTMIYAFRELREYSKRKGNNIYDSLIRLAILQSGLSPSGISFTSLIPFEDFEKIYNSTISNLENVNGLANFAETNAFYRNNWGNDDIVGYKRASFTKKGKYNIPMTIIGNNFKRAIEKGRIPQVIYISHLSREARNKFIVYTWEKYDELYEEYKNHPTYKSLAGNKNALIKRVKSDMRKRGDFSFINKGLFEKVYREDNTPFSITEVKPNATYINFVYKQINAWGDSYKAKEFYNTARKSQLDNGFLPVEKEADNQTIIQVYDGMEIKEMEFNKLPSKKGVSMTYAGIGSRQTPPEVLSRMTEIAKYLEGIGYTLNTGITFGGKEEGADAAFSRGTKKKNLFSPEKQGARAREQAIAKEIHPAPHYLSEGALKLMARNTNQVFGDDLNTPVDFVLFYAKETSNKLRPEGGTGQAVEMARRKGIPTINMMNSNWREQLDSILKEEQKTEDWQKEDNNDTCPPF